MAGLQAEGVLEPFKLKVVEWASATNGCLPAADAHPAPLPSGSSSPLPPTAPDGRFQPQHALSLLPAPVGGVEGGPIPTLDLTARGLRQRWIRACQSLRDGSFGGWSFCQCEAKPRWVPAADPRLADQVCPSALNTYWLQYHCARRRIDSMSCYLYSI